MKIAVVNANSKIGNTLVDEALKRGIEVTVFTSLPNETAATHAVQKENMDITAEDLAGFDAVIDASGVWDEEHMAGHYKALFHLCNCLSNTETRLLIVGGEGVEYSEKELEHFFENVQVHKISDANQNAATKWIGRSAWLIPGITEFAGRVKDGDPVITIETVLFDLKKRKDVNWIFMDPSCEVVVPPSVHMSVPYVDYAKDMLDELETGVRYQQRVGVTCN